MRRFFSVKDIGNLELALKEAQQVKASPFGDQDLGRNRTAIFIFFNSSLRTRLSSQKAALNLGMNAIVLNVNGDSWKLETEMGVVMDGDKPEHLREAIPVIGSYCDIIGVRSFAGLKDRDFDYAETILEQFCQYSGKPVVSLESATVHPCQAFADLITIDEYWKKRCNELAAAGKTVKKRPKVVLTWAPHPRALPQAVPNSFAQWMLAADVDFVITQPEGYELCEDFTKGAAIEYDQKKAFEGADFIYAKNWSSYTNYGQVLSMDRAWTVDEDKMAVTDNAFFMHCLPVRRNMIVSDAVIDAPTSIVIPEAANRVVSAQVVLRRMLRSLSGENAPLYHV